MKPVILVVMDGWGINPRLEGNAVALAATPNLKRFAREYPATKLLSSGNSVGLPHGQMGNSEVGHLTLGAGRVVYQELTRINMAIEDGSFFNNATLKDAFRAVKGRGSALHLMGLASDGGVHSHIDHLYALLLAARKAGLEKVYIHAFLDGRDTPPQSAKGYIRELIKKIEEAGVGRVATISGRYYAMDRDRRWDRVTKAYRAIVEGEGIGEDNPLRAIENSYGRNTADEFVLPVVITEKGKPVAIVRDGDGVISFNFRADRIRQLVRAFIEDDFTEFERKKRAVTSTFITMTEYDKRFNLPALFPPQGLKNILAEVLSKKGIQQFRLSETEKYAHVTFFFNGGVEKPFHGEDRLLIPSDRDVATYDKKPRMRAKEIADSAIERLGGGKYGFMLVNFANGDMVGHSGVLEAAIRACEAVDEAVGRVVSHALENGWAALITSDHGNAEQMLDYSTGGPHTAHTTNPVPLMLVDDERKNARLNEGLGLSSVAPAILKIMGLDVPVEMEGGVLF